MLKLLGVIGICLATFPALSQPTSQYQVATITDVKQHQTAGGADSNVTCYDVSLKVGDTIYVTLYTPWPGTNTVKYATGRDVLVLVGKKTITYNDILGQSFEVPIESQPPAAVTKASK